MLDASEGDAAAAKEKEDFLRVLNDLAGRLEHELKAVGLLFVRMFDPYFHVSQSLSLFHVS